MACDDDFNRDSYLPGTRCTSMGCNNPRALGTSYCQACWDRNSHSHKDSNPKDRAAGASGRVDMSLFPTTAIACGSVALMEGDLKYGGYNWRVEGVRASVYIAACLRHISDWLNGEDDDPVTHVPNLASSLACLAILLDARVANKLNDDRPPKVPASELLTQLESVVKHLQQLYPNGPERYRETPA